MRGSGRVGPLVLAAPSGTGKTTIARRLVEKHEDFVFSVSATTRPRREGEQDGVDYEFVTPEDFEAMREAGELAEWAEVHGNLYATPRRNLDAATGRGETVVLDIDVQGARQIRESVPDALLIFVLPPSARALVARLSGRGTEARREMLRRLRNARTELLAAVEFDHAVVNEDLEATVRQVAALAKGEEPEEPPVPDVKPVVERLRAEIDEVLARDEAGLEVGGP